MSEQLTVTNYIVRRHAREGIADCFSAEGDFAFNGGLLDAALGSSRDSRTGLLHRGRRRPIDGDRTSQCAQLSSHRSATGARRSD